ncbi:MAG: 23S rRNA methyltransferase [Candidatus Dormiibacterota bacterium]
MLDAVVSYLRCPHCAAALARDRSVLRCAGGHAFDIARQGYVNLLPPSARARTGDTAAMVQARVDFLAAGHFAEIDAALVEAAREGMPDTGSGCVVDIGAGTGHYLRAVLDVLPGRAGIALDTSVYALRRAARVHERVGAVVADVWATLPIADGAAGLALDVFAPRNGPELRRLLRPGGRLLVVTPTTDHLRELRAPLGLLRVDEQKDERLRTTLEPSFALVGQRTVRSPLTLHHDDVRAAVGMGPSAWHMGAMLADRIAALPDPIPVTAAVVLSVFRPSS